MTKSTCLLALVVAVVVCTKAIRIDVARPSGTRQYDPKVLKNDPRCENKVNGLYPNPEDCTMYIKCVNGNGRDRKCPEDFKFDFIRHCIPPSDNPDCGKKTLRSPSTLNEDEVCPETYGIFAVKSDCHKFMICRDGKPMIKNCPPNQVYRDINGGCVDGTECSELSGENHVCTRANQLLPDRNCRRYIKCVNFEPIRKECPSGTAFDATKHKCSKEQLKECQNIILNIGEI